MKSLGIAFAGFRHAHIFGLYDLTDKRDDLKIVGAWEDDETSRKAAEEKGVIFRFKTYEDLLSDPAVDIVAIGNYYAARGELAIAALRAGKHVLADKPLCTSLAEWKEISALAEEKKLTVGMMLDLRDNPNFVTALEELQEGALGKINNIVMEGQHPLLSGSRPGWYFEEGKHGGVINDIAIHGIDLARAMTGSDVEETVGAREWNFYAKDVPYFQDSAQFILKMSSGAGVVGDVSYAAPDSHGYDHPAYWQFRVWGEEGMMTWSAVSDGVMLYQNGEAAKKLPGKAPKKIILTASSGRSEMKTEHTPMTYWARREIPSAWKKRRESMKTAIINGKIITDGKVLQENVVFENGVITAMTSGEVSADQVIDAAGAYVAPGFIDIHTHGAGGADFLDGTAEAFVTAAEMQARGGAATVVATVNSSNREEMLRAIRAFDEVKKRSYVGAKIAGLHFEGPYFSPAQKGAQDEKYLKDFDKEEYEEVLSKSKDILRWSAAPELRGAKEFAASMKEHGVLAAIGHSDAECTRVEEAFKEGFTHVTHLYSCTSTVHRQNAYRYAGIVEAAYLLDDMTVEIIADGAHLPPALLKLIYKLKGSGKIALVTDSIRAAGLPEGIYRIGSLENGYDVIIEEGVAKLPDRTAFAGSVALYNRLVKNMVELAGVPLPEAVRMASETPAKIMRLKKKGRLAPGYDADFTVFDEDFTVLRTISEGKTVFLD